MEIIQEQSKHLRKFIEINPNHKLAGNAQYWYAETLRIRQLYTDAAAAYLEGYQKYPQGEKAPVNLLKLGMMLVQVGEKEVGCKMINGVEKQYPKAKQSVIQKAKYEAKKLKCDDREKNFLTEIPKLLKKYDLEKKKETKKQELLLAQKKAEEEKKKQELLLVEERTKKLQDHDRFLAKKYQVQVNQKNIDLVKDYFRKGLSKKDIAIGKKSIVKINSKDVTTEDLVNYIDETGIQESQIKKNIDKNVIEDLLSGLISTKILDYEIEEYNLLIDDETLLEIIKKNEHFHDENGIFQRTKYEKFLLSNNISAKTFETRLRKRESQKRLFDLIIDGTIGSNKKYKVSKAKEPKQEEFKPENKDVDNQAPIIEVAKNLKFESQTFKFKGRIKDKNKFYLTANGRPVKTDRKGRFEIEGFVIDPEQGEQLN
jgi:tol-pal system protein YbgF